MTDENTIYLIQGDDSNFDSNIALSITLTSSTEINLANYKARFQIGDYIIKDYDDISSGLINVVITKTDTMKLPIGTSKAAVKLFDSNNRSSTILKDIKVQVSRGQVDNK